MTYCGNPDGSVRDCRDFPRCSYDGTIGQYVCQHGCFNTEEEGSCGTGRVCLCFNETPCSACPSYGQWPSACNDVTPCGPSDDTSPPDIEITYPTDTGSYDSVYSPITISGTITEDNVISFVKYYNDRNEGFVRGSGDAVLNLTNLSGTFSAGPINLEPGMNTITVNARDGSLNNDYEYIYIDYDPTQASDYPDIQVTETATDYIVDISDSDGLTETAWAWADPINVYFIPGIPYNSDHWLSDYEKDMYRSLWEELPGEWDRLTQSRHPLLFHFIEPVLLWGYYVEDDSLFNYVESCIAEADYKYPDYLRYPRIFVFPFPDPLFNTTGAVSYSHYNRVGEVYISEFHNNSWIVDEPNSEEVLRNMIIHELSHTLAHLPNDVNFPPGDTLYFRAGHTAGFYGSGDTCGPNTTFGSCQTYPIQDSPTGTEGYYEAYSIKSPIGYWLASGETGRSNELSPLVEMELGIRSRYEDSPYLFHEGSFFYNEGGGYYFSPVTVHDFGLSSKRFHDYNGVELPGSDFWDIRFNNNRTEMGSLSSFSVPKSGQQNRSLIIYASDPDHPGYFRVFNFSSDSNTNVVDTQPPEVVNGLSLDGLSPGRIDISWNPCRDNMGPVRYAVFRNSSFIAWSDTNSYSDTGLEAGTYFYQVASYDIFDNVNEVNDAIIINLNESANYSFKMDEFCEGLVFISHFDRDWPDENSTYYRDYSSQANDLTCQISTCPAINEQGMFRRALSFGINDFIEDPDPSGLDFGTGEFTIHFWIYPRNTTVPGSSAVSRTRDSSPYGGWLAGLSYSPGSFGMFMNESFVSETGPISEYEWHNIVITRSGFNISIYHNGALADTGQLSALYNSDVNSGLRIGKADGWNGFSGMIDEVAIWNRSLDPEEIEQIMINTDKIPCSSFHRSDSDSNGCIELPELLPFIELWKMDSTNYPMWEMMESINKWDKQFWCT